LRVEAQAINLAVCVSRLEYLNDFEVFDLFHFGSIGPDVRAVSGS
jgi:hypothetical protein